ncbi:MAG: RidA family protein [Deltaproteobacteria bacterium]|nr:RidA family protein [Deltaproteobacteria bacterium]
MKQVILTKNAPAAIGPYSQAIRVGDLVFTAGQAAVDPERGKLIEGGIEEQTRQTLRNIEAILEAAGSSMNQVVKTTVFLKDMGDFAAMNAIYAGFFGDVPPARSTVQVAALPLGALVEIEAVATRVRA